MAEYIGFISHCRRKGKSPILSRGIGTRGSLVLCFERVRPKVSLLCSILRLVQSVSKYICHPGHYSFSSIIFFIPFGAVVLQYFSFSSQMLPYCRLGRPLLGVHCQGQCPMSWKPVFKAFLSVCWFCCRNTIITHLPSLSVAPFAPPKYSHQRNHESLSIGG